MTASNWQICPRCRHENTKSIEELYGTITLDKFMDKLHEVDDDEKYRTFREDYEIYGADVGLIQVDYNGECTECGLRFTFHKEFQISVLDWVKDISHKVFPVDSYEDTFKCECGEVFRSSSGYAICPMEKRRK
jgi:hypothetical protein